MGRNASVLAGRQRVAIAAALLAALVAWDLVAGALPAAPLWADVLLASFILVPATFVLVWLALPLRAWRGLGAVGLSLAVLSFALVAIDLDLAANFVRFGAAVLVGFWFLTFFERLSWVVLVAAIIPLVDAFSVWRGPTRHIVEREPTVFRALSFAFPVPGEGAVHLGLPDLLFFALFLGAAVRWFLRPGWTWLAMVASFGATMALAIGVDPFGIGGLPALPLLALSFVLPNADLLWRGRRYGAAEDGGGWTASSSGTPTEK